MESFEDLNFTKDETLETILPKIQEKMGITPEDLKVSVLNSVSKRYEEIAQDFPNLAPYNKYKEMLTEKSDMAEFIKNECVKPENWKLFQIKLTKLGETDMLQFTFDCTAMDEENPLKGHVFVNKNSKVKYSFAKYSM